MEQFGQIFIQLSQLVHLIAFSDFKFLELYRIPMAILNENGNLLYKLLIVADKCLFKVLADPVDVVHPLLKLDLINLLVARCHSCYDKMQLPLACPQVTSL